MSCILISLRRSISPRFHLLQRLILQWTTPPHNSLLPGTVMDLARGKSELVAENALLQQQLQEATPYGQIPRYLIRDNDGKFGPCFARVAATSGIKILKTPYHAPQANAICERFLGSVRRECLDHVLTARPGNGHA